MKQERLDRTVKVGRAPYALNQQRQVMLDRRTKRARTRAAQQRRAARDWQ